jgi:hypothetical protein
LSCLDLVLNIASLASEKIDMRVIATNRSYWGFLPMLNPATRAVVIKTHPISDKLARTLHREARALKFVLYCELARLHLRKLNRGELACASRTKAFRYSARDGI